MMEVEDIDLCCRQEFGVVIVWNKSVLERTRTYGDLLNVEFSGVKVS